MKKIFFQLITAVSVLSVLILGGCKHAKPTREVTSVRTPSFKTPEIPSYIQDDYTLGKYMSTHYWNDFDFSDTLWLAHQTDFEKVFSDYIGLLTLLDADRARVGIDTLFVHMNMTGKLNHLFDEVTEKYLGNPNSPMRNESLFICFLEHQLSRSGMEEWEVEQLQSRLDNLNMNREGTLANNFSFESPSGSKGNLYQFKSEYNLILFLNPDCPMCKHLVGLLRENKAIEALHRAHRLQVFAMYVDEDFELWKRGITHYPDYWKNGCDPTLSLRNGAVYDLNAIPTIYLLDRNHRVLLKDPTPEAFFSYMEAL